MLSYTELKKSAKQDGSGLFQYKIAIAGDSSTQYLATAIKGYGKNHQLCFDILDSGYDQINAQLMDPSSELYHFSPDAVIVSMCVEKLYEEFCRYPLEERKNFADLMINRILGYWGLINGRIKAQILQFSFVEKDDFIYGNLGSKLENSFIYQVRKMNYLLSEQALQYGNVHIINLNYVVSLIGIHQFFDSKMYLLARITMSEAALPFVAKQVTDIISSILGRIKKCIVLDLDNTLWGGIIGDDGLENIQIGELGIGRAFTEFQLWLKELRKRGILLAVCSKNDEEKAKEPFIKHPDMVLRLEDITLFVANWEDKASNIMNICRRLNIGMDSIVYIDDSPFERNLVKQLIPDITVPDMPEDPSQYLDYLKEKNYFDTASYSELDEDRTRQYKDEIERKVHKKQFQDYESYLKNLHMKSKSEHFLEAQYVRISELSQRSNQFNFRTTRYTIEDVKEIAESKNFISLSFSLEDRFGKYGLISVVILKILNQDELFIETWFMSCRVLKRGMEQFIINKIVATAKGMGYKKIIGEYIETKKNHMVRNIYEELGFTKIDETHFEVNVNEFKENKTNVEEMV